MADSKLSALPAATPVGTDELYLLDDPGGSPASKRATVQGVVDLVVVPAAPGDIGAATDAQGAKADTAVQPGDPVGLNAQSGAAYTLAIGDAGKIVEMTDGSANTVTIPTEASVAFAAGTIVNVTQAGAGVTTITAAAGVALNGVTAGSAALSAQWGAVSLYKRAADSWVIQGAHGGVS